jgi:hypothetical protein
MSPELQSPTIEEQEKTAGLISTGLKKLTNGELDGDDLELLPDEEIEVKETRPYDADAVQAVNITVPRGEKNFHVSFKMNPLSDERFFKMVEQVPEQIKRIRIPSPEVFLPYAEVGRQLAIERFGYKPNPNWREKTHPHDFISAVIALTEVDFYFEGLEATEDELLDDDAEVPIKLISAFDGEECITTIWFQEETKEVMDEYFALQQNQPRKNVLASAKKVSKERRMFALYQELQVRADGYVNRVPAWHAIKAVEGFLQLQVARLGKLPSALQG